MDYFNVERMIIYLKQALYVHVESINRIKYQDFLSI